MKKLFGTMFVMMMAVLAGCATSGQTEAVSIYTPLIGVWNTTEGGMATILEIRANRTIIRRTTIEGVQITQQGKWYAGTTTLTQKWPNQTNLIQHYSINAIDDVMVLSLTLNGLTTTYVSMN